MRIALISDIHGNFVSLEAVLADIDRVQVDKIICLGDIATIGSQPHRVLERIRSLGCECIMGNHDTFLLDQALVRAYMDAPWFTENVAWCVDRLSPADFDFLGTFQPLLEVPLDDGANLLCFHGSPKSNFDNILATTPAAELDEMLAGQTATVMAGGHTHVQMMRQHNGQMLVNTGSIGLPFEKLPFEITPRILPWAEYSIIDWTEGLLGVELHRVPIDLDATKQAALDSDMPDRLDWVKYWTQNR